MGREVCITWQMLETLKQPLRALVFGWSPSYAAYSKLRELLFLKEYRHRREYYQGLCERQGLRYEESEVTAQIRKHVAKRGYSPSRKEIGDIHTFAIIPRLGWHSHLYDELYEMGPVTEFDYIRYGYDALEFYRADKYGQQRRLEMNTLILPAIRESHARKSIDWVFVYASGTEVSANTIRQIHEEIGVPVINMCLDDKHSWAGKWMGDHRGNQIDVAKIYDLSWTSARIACDWYLAEGGRPIYMPEGCNPTVYKPISSPKDIPVSFIGSAYGFRKRIVRFAKRYGVNIQTFGEGWNTHVLTANKMVETLCRSQINLGMGGIGYSEWLTNVKGRDFEIPCTGGGMYLTSYNADLALHFDIGREIVCYRTNDEMIELIRYYLNHPEDAAQIARQGRERCLREHRWMHRYIKICRILGILQ
jgi:Glycosyl transferases group 1